MNTTLELAPMTAEAFDSLEQDTDSPAHSEPEAPAAHVVVILNPASGSVKNAQAEGDNPTFRERIEAALSARGATFEVRETTPTVGADVLARQAAEEGAQRVVVCGGDGTVMAAVNGLFAGEQDAPDEGEEDTRPVLSIVPGGTANLLAAALGIPTDVDEAVEAALEGVERSIDLGRCGRHVFALGLGLGLTEKVISQASAREKETLGKLAYAKAMLREVGARPTRFRFRIDHEPDMTARGVGIVIANAGKIGGGLHFAPDALMDDGQLDLCILHRFDVRDVLRMTAKMLIGGLPDDRAVTFLQGRSIEILSEPPLDLQIDGEAVEESTPLHAQVLPGALRVRIPALADLKMEGEKIEKVAPELAGERSHRWLPLLAVAAAAMLAAWARRR